MQNLDKDILIKNIKSLMDKNGMKQEHLAKAINVGQPSISKCLSGKQSISIDLAYSIAKHFDVTLDDLCRGAVEKTTEETPTPQTLSAKDEFIKACEGLADVFKFTGLHTKEIDLREVAYVEEYGQNGYPTGYYGPKKDQFNMDPVHKYIAMFFPNYATVETAFSSQAEADEYFSELRCCGNLINRHYHINKFLTQLADLNSIYQNGSMTKEAYFHAIDSNLEKVRE